MKRYFLSVLIIGLLITINSSDAEWVIRRPMPHARYGAFVATVNNKLYVIGGLVNPNTAVPFVEEYNPALDTWILKAPMPFPRGLGVCGVVNGKIYCIGGVRARNTPVETVEVYDPSINQWQRKRRVPMRYFGYNGGVIGDSIYLCGGFFPNPSSYTDTMIVYYVSRDSWFTRQSMNTARVNFGSAVLNNHLYAIGGLFYSNYLNINERYSAANNSWQTRDTLRLGRAGLTGAILNNFIFAIGGERHVIGHGRIIYNRVDIYNSITNAWGIGESINIARSYAGSATINNQIFVVGGITRSLNPTATLEQYMPAGIEETNNQIAYLPKLSVSPNPFKHLATLRFTGNSNDNTIVKIYNNSGDLVKTLAINKSNGYIVWDRTDDYQNLLPAGVYFASVTDSNFNRRPYPNRILLNRTRIGYRSEVNIGIGQKNRLTKIVILK